MVHSYFRQQFKFLSFEDGNNTYLSPRGGLVIHVEKRSEILGRKVLLEILEAFVITPQCDGGLQSCY